MALDSGYVYCGFECIVCEVDKNDSFFLDKKNQNLLNQVAHQFIIVMIKNEDRKHWVGFVK